MPTKFFALYCCLILSLSNAISSDAEQLYQDAQAALTKAEKIEAERDSEDEEAPEGDFAAAFALFKKSAEAGSPKGALKVSQLLLLGQGVPKDTIGAFEWAKKSADMGNLNAQLLTASKYEEGRGTKKSLPDALALYEKALTQGSAAARIKVANLLHEGGKESGIKQDRARALTLFQDSAKAGAPAAIYMVGLYLQRGYEVTKDDKAASQWFIRAAEIGEPQAQRKLAMRYFRGTGVEQDPIEAIMWAELALKNPTGDAETKNLAREYLEMIRETVTPRKSDQAMRKVERFKQKTFKEIILPQLPYTGPDPTYLKLTDTSGTVLEAAVISLDEKSVTVQRKGDGAKFTIPLERLSEETRNKLRSAQ